MTDLARAKELFLAALSHQEKGELADAERLYRQALELAPDRPSVMNNLAAVLMRQQRFSDAAPLCRRVAAASPRAPTAMLNLGNCQLAIGKPQEALASLNLALALQPHYLEALVSRASTLLDLDRPADALADSERALEIDPGCIEALSNRGVALRRLRRYEEALISFDRALEIDPRCADALVGRSHTLLDLGRPEEALAPYELPSAIGPRHDDALTNRSVALMNPSRVEGSRSLLLLLAGRLEEGWSAYRYRSSRQLLGIPAVSGDELSTAGTGALIDVRGEQGLGDQLFFLRWIPRLRGHGFKPRLKLDPRLRGLLARSPDIAAEELADSGPDLIKVAIGDLPLLLSGGERYPGSIRLAPDPDRLAAMRTRLEAFGPSPYIGVAWRAGTPIEEQVAVAKVLSKAVPLEVLARMLAGTSATVVSVQRAPAPGETEMLTRLARLPVYDLSAANLDLEDALALMTLLDQYVGVSSTNVHLRAAASRESRVLVPNPPEWRWGVQGESPWFPGTDVYREQGGRGWDEAVAWLRRDLALAP